MDIKIFEFLKESNAIEKVYDNDSFLQAKYAWEYLMTQDQMNPQVVKKTHKILMLNQKLQPDEKGYYRHVGIMIGGRKGLDWKEVPEAMRDWCKDMNANIENSREHVPKIMHVVYEKIHPFVDGNGRTGRMFMNWQRLKKLNLPLLIIHTGIEQKNYYEWFQ